MEPLPHEKWALVKEYLPIIPGIVRSIAMLQGAASCPEEDLYAYGVLGLIEAARRYDPTQGPFCSFARIRIRGQIIDELRVFGRGANNARLPKRQVAIKKAEEDLAQVLGRSPTQAELAKHLDVPLELVETRPRGVSLMPEDVLAHCAEETRHPDNHPSDHPADEVIELTFWEDVKQALQEALEHLTSQERKVIDLRYRENLTLREIGLKLGMSESRACQVTNRALRRLKLALEVARPDIRDELLYEAS